MREVIIDSIFTSYKDQGILTSQRLKYLYRFSDRLLDPLEALSEALEKDTIETISILAKGKKWEMTAFRNEIHSPQSLARLEIKLKRMAYLYKVDRYVGFQILPADIDISQLSTDKFYPFILSLSNDDLFNVAKRLNKINEHDKALITLQELINRKFKSDTAFFLMGSSLIATNEYIKGIEHWKKAVELNAEYFDAYMELGQVFFENSHWKQSYANFKEADRLKPNNDIVLYNLAKSLIKLQRYNEAYAVIKRAVKLNPRNKYAAGVLRSLNTPQMRKLRKESPGK